MERDVVRWNKNHLTHVFFYFLGAFLFFFLYFAFLINATDSETNKAWLNTLLLEIVATQFLPVVMSVYLSNSGNKLTKRYLISPITSLAGIAVPVVYLVTASLTIGFDLFKLTTSTSTRLVEL